MNAPVFDETFKAARMKAAQGQLVIIRSDGKHLLLPALRKETLRPEMVNAVEQLIPSKIKRNVSVIADTSWAEEQAPTLQGANSAIPFFGLLMGLTTIGHSVWIHNGACDVLEAGCTEADVLIVDSARLGLLSPDWQNDARKQMRNSQILIHDRGSYQLRKP